MHVCVGTYPWAQGDSPSEGSRRRARRPCLELLWTNILSDTARTCPSTFTVVDTTTWGGQPAQGHSPPVPHTTGPPARVPSCPAAQPWGHHRGQASGQLPRRDPFTPRGLFDPSCSSLAPQDWPRCPPMCRSACLWPCVPMGACVCPCHGVCVCSCTQVCVPRCPCTCSGTAHAWANGGCVRHLCLCCVPTRAGACVCLHV